VFARAVPLVVQTTPEGAVPQSQSFLADEQAAMSLVTEVLQNVGPSVTRFSPTCYAELLEY
jgi:hypothetical protein